MILCESRSDRRSDAVAFKTSKDIGLAETLRVTRHAMHPASAIDSPAIIDLGTFTFGGRMFDPDERSREKGQHESSPDLLEPRAGLVLDGNAREVARWHNT